MRKRIRKKNEKNRMRKAGSIGKIIAAVLCVAAFTLFQAVPVSAADIKSFPRIGVVGDSLASGEIAVDGKLTDVYSLSWPQIMGKRNGVIVTNYSKGGLTTYSWLSEPEGIPRLAVTPPDDLYILALGANDSMVVEEMLLPGYLGSLKDITETKNYSRYADSFYGNYGRIIEQIRAHAPASKIILVNINFPGETVARYNEAIAELAEYYKIPCIDQSADEYFLSDTYLNMEMGHPTKAGYDGMADAFTRLINDCIMKNPGYFFGIR